MITFEDGRTHLYQWDVNQRLLIDGYPAGTQVHFENRRIGLLDALQNKDGQTALTVEAYKESGKVYANVPNILLQTAGELSVYVYAEKGDEAHTDERCFIKVIPRARPDDYIYTETQILRWIDIADHVDAATESAETAASKALNAEHAAQGAASLANLAASNATEAAEAARAAADAVGDEIDGITIKDTTNAIDYLAKFRIIDGQPAIEYTEI